MTTAALQTIKTLSTEYHLSEDVIIQESLKVFLEKKLREIKTDIYKIYGKYRVTSVEALEACMENGIVEEKDVLDDYHRLDHLEYKRDELTRFLQELQ